MKQIIRLLVASLFGIGLCEAAKEPIAPENWEPILDHIVAPREAWSLNSTNAWQFATVTNGTDWLDTQIKWRTKPIPIHHFWRGGDVDPKPNVDYYRRTIELKPEQAQCGGALFFELITPHYEIRMNGTVVRYENQLVGSMPQRVDVSGLLKAGENRLEVMLFRHSTPGHLMPAYAYGWAEGPWTGISRPVHFELYNRVNIQNLRIETRVAAGKVLLVDALVTNSTDRAVSVSVDGSVENADPGVMLISGIEKLGPKEGRVVTLQVPWETAKLWTPDEPNLYYLTIYLRQEGQKEPIDALRQRFGFREIGYHGRQLTLNGIPLLMRRETFGFGDLEYDMVAARKMVSLLKEKGYNSSRCGTEVLYRDARIADEEGYLLTPLPNTGGPYQRWDPYWTPCSNLVSSLVTTFRNHPSITHWSLFNEFGPKFGVPLEQSAKTAAIGAYANALDPTRFWVSTGDYEMSSKGVQEAGPTGMRSLHYPINLTWGYLPDVAYWLANDGGWGSWEIDYKKPVGISEDLFHGMNDKPFTMGQWHGDTMFTPEGYRQAWREAMEMFADGYYYSGLSEWNPWATDPIGKFNQLYREGPLMPTYLISRRHAFPNVAANESFTDQLFVFNKSFAMKKAKLKLVNRWKGKTHGTRVLNVELPAGGRWTGELSFTAPRVTGLESGLYEVEAQLYEGTNVLAKRTFEFYVVPQDVKHMMPEGTVLVDYHALTGSAVRVFFAPEQIFTNAAAAVAAVKRTRGTLLVTGPVPAEDGKAFDAWVNAGGRATLLLGQHVGWSPASVVEKQYHNYAWRRTADFLPEVDERLWRVWRPSGRLSEKGLVKEPTLDMDVLLDFCVSSGFVHADVLRIWRNAGGAWLVTTLPIEEQFSHEPAARYLVSRLVDSQKRLESGDRSRGYGFASLHHPYAPIFKQNGFPEPQNIAMALQKGMKPEQLPVALVDGSQPIVAAQQMALLNYARQGGVVLVTEASATNRAFLARLGLGIHPRGAVYSFINRRNTWHWTTPLGYRGVIKEPYYKPEIISAKEPFTDEQVEQICYALENQGQIGIDGECPENRPLLDQKRIEWREANLDWFTRVGNPDLLDGIANSDLYFSKINLDRYQCWMMRKDPTETEAGMDMYSQTPEAISMGSLYPYTGRSGETCGVRETLPKRDAEAKDAIFCTYPAILADVSIGKGRVVVLTLDSANFRGKYPQKFIRMYRQILGNLGVKTSQTAELVRYRTTPHVGKAERQLWDNPKYEKPAPVLFENGEDLRYFPVNQRGWSLASNNECPVEPFPQEAMLFGGIPFQIPIPNFRNGSSVSVDAGGYGILGAPPEPLCARRVWILGALDQVPTDPKVLSGEKPVMSFTWIFKGPDGSRIRKTSNAYYGKEVGAYMHPLAPTGNGRIAWEGYTGTGKPAVLYAFSMENPYDLNEPLIATHYTTCGGGIQTAVIAITWEPL